MPSNTAFLIPGLPETDLVTAYDSCDISGRLYPSRPLDLGVRGLSIRNVYQPIMALEGLGIHIDTSTELFKALRTIVITNYSLLMLQGAWRTVIAAATARETALATTETAALAAAQQWGSIAQGVIAAGMFASFFAAEQVGEKFGSGEWNFPSGDIRLPGDRRRMEGQLASTGLVKHG